MSDRKRGDVQLPWQMAVFGLLVFGAILAGVFLFGGSQTKNFGMRQSTADEYRQLAVTYLIVASLFGVPLFVAGRRKMRRWKTEGNALTPKSHGLGAAMGAVVCLIGLVMLFAGIGRLPNHILLIGTGASAFIYNLSQMSERKS